MLNGCNKDNFIVAVNIDRFAALKGIAKLTVELLLPIVYTQNVRFQSSGGIQDLG
jgi:hypothetical protein